MPPIPLSLYVHIPWCVRKCPYCDFNSHEAPGELPETAYVDALLRDLEQDLPQVWGRRLESIFIGGGTPSLFSPESIDRLLAGVRALLAFAPQTEVTLEANPGAVEAGRFGEYRAAGVNRLSIGVQSFDGGMLTRIGRIHGPREAIRAAEQAHYAGLDNFNLDLMYALPGQTVDQAARDLATAVDLEPAHISHYQLTLEPNTAFYRAPPVLPDDETQWAMQEACQGPLERRGYAQYEVSAYARGQTRCRHNLNYWRFGDYLGIGAGAHGKISSAGAGEVLRLHKQRHPRAYLAASGAGFVSGRRVLDVEDRVLEFMLNALRLTAGVPLALFPARTGLDAGLLDQALALGRDKGLLEVVPDRLCATGLGQRFLNDTLALFMPV